MTTQLNRLPRRMAALFAITALSLGAAACSSSSDDKASGDSSSATSSESATSGKAAAGSDSSSSSASGNSSDTSANSGSNASSSTGGGNGAAAGSSSGSRCHTDDLKAAFATGGDAVPDMKGDNQTQASVALTNISKRSCTLNGFPGVDMVGDQASDGTWSLARSSKPTTTISLSPGDTTDFSITLGATTEKGAGAFVPGLVRITPPNEKTQFALKWPFGGAVTKQDGATHPATYVNPIGS
ncbi:MULTISPECIES: DUF4232 domain-containing protein [unclassified Streptomyces]|uniref:DUF4232 domain-containing protein n=1 Tax=unclassified Streptomyces TaxID=2593676 RepID=UPI002E1F7A58|nr:DUF4232 domain-containing protein [Streptomyces sp. NBC_01023]